MKKTLYSNQRIASKIVILFILFTTVSSYKLSAQLFLAAATGENVTSSGVTPIHTGCDHLTPGSSDISVIVYDDVMRLPMQDYSILITMAVPRTQAM